MKSNEFRRLIVRIMAEHGQVILSGDFADDETCVVKLNPAVSHVPFDQMINDFITRYPATLDYLRRRWGEMQ